MSTSEVAQYTVPEGPFKGVQALAGELIVRIDESTGRDYSHWDTHARTRHFLTKFDPSEGWRVIVTQQQIPDAYLTDYSVPLNDGSFAVNPAWLFTATLLDKDNQPVANASVVQLFNCAMSIEIGQTRARGKLYQALGLSSSPSNEDDARQPNQVGRNSPTPKVVPVVDVPDASQSQTPASAAPAEAAQVEPSSEAAESQQAAQDAPQSDAEATDEADAATTDDASQQADHEFDRDSDLPQVTVIPEPATVATGPMSPAAAKAQAKELGAVPDGLLRQIKIRATKAKVDVPEFTTIEQAKAFLAQLVNPAAKADLVSGGG